MGKHLEQNPFQSAPFVSTECQPGLFDNSLGAKKPKRSAVEAEPKDTVNKESSTEEKRKLGWGEKGSQGQE